MPLRSDEFPPGFAAWLEPLFEGRARFVAGLAPAPRWVAGAAVEAFVGEGRGPTLAALQATSPYAPEEVEAALRHLDERDLLVLEGDRVLALYPFSDRPGRHRVWVGGRRLDAMWAGGAIAIPIVYGDGTEARVESVCAQCDSAIGFAFTVTANGARSDDPAAHALREWDPIPTPKDRAEPHMLDGMWTRVQFFCTEEHFDRWKARRPEEEGFAIDFHQSARICFEFYGGLRREFAAPTSPAA